MNNYTDEDIRRIHQRRNDRERRETLKAIRDKIRRGIENNNTRGGERAIWELVQNARDLSEHACISIHLKRNEFEFAHMGEPFNIDTLSNLIKQQSTKHEGQDSVGQYGTGFMTTHVFSRKVFISGDCWVDDEKGGGVYLSLPDGFCLDRTSDTEDTFIEELGAELEMVDHFIDRIKDGHSSPAPWTSFTYPIEDTRKADKVSSQLARACKLIPYVLTFNERIQSISITDDISGEQVSFSKHNLARESIQMSYDDTVCKVVTRIKKSAPNRETLVEVHSLESANGDDRIIIPPLPIGFEDVTCIPSQFLFFPLIGTENFGTNFIFHSARLYPTDERNSYLLPKDDDNVVSKYKHNEKVLGELFKMLFAYYNSHPEKQCLPIEFAKVSIARSETEVPDKIRRDYLDCLQKTFVENFIHWEIIPTDEGFMSIDDDDLLQVLAKDVYGKLTDEQLQVYIPVFYEYASRFKTLPKENLVEWSKVVYGWAPNEVSYYITIDDVCKNIFEKDDNLKPLLQMLKALGLPGVELMEKYALIPNREGELKKSGSLKNAKDITSELYSISKPILGARAEHFVDPAFSDLVSLVTFSRKDLRDALKAEIDDIRDKTHKRTYNANTYPICLSDSPCADLTVDNLVAFCSAFPVENPQNYRANVMKALCAILGKEFNLVVIPAVEEDEVDMYSSVFNYLLDDTLLSISQMDSDWLTSDQEGQKHLASLAAFVKELINTQDDNKKKRLNDYGIIPNRLFELRRPQDLKKSATTLIPENVLDLYKELTDVLNYHEISDYRSILVHKDFVDFYDYPECKASDITAKMEELIREQDEDYSLPETRAVVLKIIEGIDNGEWPDCSIFRDIRDKKATIFFKNTVSGEKSKHIYTLLRQDKNVLEDLAEMTADPNFGYVIAYARELLQQKIEEESDFQFKKAIGNHIEALLREKLGDSVDKENFQFFDVQDGQDIVVFYRDRPIFFVEVKTKWNFTSSGPAYMSKNQVLKACEKRDSYALCCVDLSNYNLPDRSYPESLDRILDCIKMKFEIGDNLVTLLKPSMEANSADPENNISIDGDFKARIPAGAFRSGDSFDDLVSRIIEQARNVTD